MNIGKIRHNGLRRLYAHDDARGVPDTCAKRLRNILAALDFGADLSQIERCLEWRLHELKGERRGTYAISVTGNWRFTFQIAQATVTDLDFENYH
ncbi:MAG: type II toxin-antitoxin system RelE/ParE family toxin [Gemmatimonadaceae bacterium]